MRLFSYKKNVPKGRTVGRILVGLLLPVSFLPRITERSIYLIQPVKINISLSPYTDDSIISCV